MNYYLKYKKINSWNYCTIKENYYYHKIDKFYFIYYFHCLFYIIIKYIYKYLMIISYV